MYLDDINRVASMNWTEFFSMGGYAAFVWPAYGLAFLVLIINVVAPLIQHRQVRTELDKQRRAARASESSKPVASVHN